MKCVNIVSFSVMVNGGSHKSFIQQRGIRPGDPLSPYLFILCAKALFALLNKVVASGDLHGIKVSRSAPMISHLFFVDDSIIFSRATKEEVTHISVILKDYETAFGQRIDFDKSELPCSQNVSSTKQDELIQLMGVKAVENQEKYLGLPTLVGRSNL